MRGMLRRWWPFVCSRLSYEFGNGLRMKFWRDLWCNDTLFCIASLPYLLWLTPRKHVQVIIGVGLRKERVETPLSPNSLVTRRWRMQIGCC